MERTEVLKVKGGKLLKVALRSENGLIEEVRITGDFFVYPEGAVEALEEKLRGTSKGSVKGRIEAQAKELRMRAIGFNLEDLINMIERCMR